MSQNVITVDQQQSPFAKGVSLGAGANAGAVAIEQERAIAEAQGQLILAKKFPRDENAAFADLMRACKSKAFAEVAFYSVPNRGSGPSIRFAEEVARAYGNFQYGHRELSRDGNKSEIEVYAWDMEKNNRSIRQITVLHLQDTKNGPKALRDQADIDNKIANVASKQVRGRIMALMPKWLVEEAIQECRKTIAGNNDEPIEARVRRMTQAFAKFGVTTSHLERYLGHPLDQTLSDELVDLIGIFNSIKEGAAASDFFGAEQQAEESEKTAAAITDAAKTAAATTTAKRTPRTTTKTSPEAQPEPEVTDSKPVEKESTPVEEAAPEVTQVQAQQDADAAPADQSTDDDVF